MTSALVALLTGFLLGLRHAGDPDHVVAVSTVVARGGGIASAIRVGALWGLGHSAMVLVAGGAMVATGVVVSERTAGLLELGVAVMLLVLGVTGVRRAVAALRAGRGDGASPASPPPAAPRGWARPVIVGLVHGLAGSAAIALAILAGVSDRSVALAYLVTFGAGTLVGMALVTVLLAAPVSLAARRLDARWAPRAAVLFGAMSLVIGAWMFHRIGFVEGVLTPDARAATAP